MSEVIYYYNSHDGSTLWAIFPDNMVNGTFDSYSLTSSAFDTEWLNANDCPGTDLGTISKVELRAYGYGDGDDKITLTAWFGGQYPGVAHDWVPTGTPAWSGWIDITSDPNAPTWDWAEIQQTDCVVQYIKSGKANSMYIGEVQIQVTYEPGGPPSYYHGLTVQGEGELALCDAGSHPLRIRKGGTTYGIELVAIDDPNASRVRIETPTGIKAIRRYT